MFIFLGVWRKDNIFILQFVYWINKDCDIFIMFIFYWGFCLIGNESLSFQGIYLLNIYYGYYRNYKYFGFFKEEMYMLNLMIKW